MIDRYLASLLGENEEIVLVTRQHWLVLLGEILSESVLTVALAVLISLVWQVWYPHPLMPLAYLVLLFPLVSLIWDVLDWRKHKYVVTSRRVVEVAGILNKEATDSSLEKVNDVKLLQSLFGRMFDYGNVEILTASEAGVSRFRRVSGPIRLKTAMLNAKDRLERNLSRPLASTADGEVLDILAHLSRLQLLGVLSAAEVQQKKAELLTRLRPNT
jgi:uncharacterized membrane protein YdbT with pleckstrin-like domain